MDKQIITRFIKQTNLGDFDTIKGMENLVRKFIIQNYKDFDKSYFKTDDFKKEIYRVHSAICRKERKEMNKRELEINKLVKFIMKKYKDNSCYSKTDIGGIVISHLEEEYDYRLSTEEIEAIMDLAWDLCR